jgi:hypothetical protein
VAARLAAVTEALTAASLRLVQRSDLAPGQPGPGVSLRDQVLGQQPVARRQQDDAQAVVSGCRVELGELALLLLHTGYTSGRPFSLHSFPG